LLALAAVAPPAALGLPWTIRVWQSDEGLPYNTVVGTEQTPDGFLWVATPAGLVRFVSMACGTKRARRWI
jgi:ligand-binding sensor domain-containing protein